MGLISFLFYLRQLERQRETDKAADQYPHL